MTGTRADRIELGGVMRLTWVTDHLAHVLEHSQSDEPTGTCTGLACPDHGLEIGTDVDNSTLLHLAHGDLADFIWEAPADFTAEHGQLSLAAIRAYQDGEPEVGQQLWQQAEALWPRIFSQQPGDQPPANRRPDPVLPRQTAALGDRIVRASLRPIRSGPSPHP